MSERTHWSRWAFRVLLRAYPRRIRDELGGDMWLTFESHLREAHSRSWVAVFRVWLRELVALWRDGRRARLSANGQISLRRDRPVVHKREFLLGISALDFKLGLRMLVKYPGLTVVGGVGIAVAVAIGVGVFGFVESFADPSLPFDQDDQLVTIESWNVETNRKNGRVLHDFVTWREESNTIAELGAAIRIPGRNLITEDGRVELTRMALVTAAGISITRIPPLIGRTLLKTDESPDAPPVIVLGYTLWRDVFAGNPNALGASVRVGDVEHTIVGVMPEGYGFPVSEEAWVPLRLDPMQFERGEGPELIVFGRLAHDATLNEARVELATIALRTAAAYPETNAALRPRIMPYALPFLDIDDPQTLWLIRTWQYMMSLVLVAVCVNVSILVYARTAMRQREIGVRTALGATRRRVVAQLFAEAFVLSAMAATIGLILAAVAVRKIDAFWLKSSATASKFPYWLDISLPPSAALYAFVLAVLSSVIVGVVPGLKATGRDVHTNLQRLGVAASGGSLGNTWTFLIITQVAVAVAILPLAAFQTIKQVRAWHADAGFAVEELVTARITLEDSSLQAELGIQKNSDRSDHSTAIAALESRLENEPTIRGVTFAHSGFGDARGTRVETDDFADARTESQNGQSRQRRFAFANDVSVDFFETIGVSLVAGRHFVAADLHGDIPPIIVNRSFAQSILRRANPLGRLVRETRRTADRDGGEGREFGPWHQIVGVIENFANNPNFDGAIPTIYYPTGLDQLSRAFLAVRMRSNDVTTVVTRIREIGAAVDPTMRLHGIVSQSYVQQQERLAVNATALVSFAAMSCIVLLSSAGIYALMSFTVTRRRREIGIRTALGGQARHILTRICARAGAQLTAGIAVGAALAAALDIAAGGLLFDGNALLVLTIGSTTMMAVGFVAALGPARRGLRVQPTEALREDV